MGDASTPLSPSDARHLLRRTGFGAPPEEVQRIIGLTRGQAVGQILAFRPKRKKPTGREFERIHNKWIKIMLRAKQSHVIQEKLVLFLHDHFSTAFSTVQNAKFMAKQNKLLRVGAKGSFKQLVKDMNRNAAMMEFLDTVRNDKFIPNENYARELLELFTTGVKDFNGDNNYIQEDIVQISRAFTGWRSKSNGKPIFEPESHDFTEEFPERGPKVIFKATGGFGPGGISYAAAGEGESEIDQLIDVIFQHRDSDGQNTVARRMAFRFMEYFAHPSPNKAVVDQIVAESGFDTNFDIASLLGSLLVHDAFYESGVTPPFGANSRKSVRWPIDFVIGTLRAFKMKLGGRELELRGGEYRPILSHLDQMGQILMEPPSVFGWDWETDWLSSFSLLARYRFVRDVTAARGNGSKAFRPKKFMDLELTDPNQIVDTATDLLGVTDQLTSNERSILLTYLTDGGVLTSLDLDDEYIREKKLAGLFALILQSPACQVH